MTTQLIDFITTLDLNLAPTERWAILGPQAERLRRHIQPGAFQTTLSPPLDGLLLVEALSAHPEPLSWLAQTIAGLQAGSRLIIVDWQADGSLEHGPPLASRVKRGSLCRWLRENGFAQADTLRYQGRYYAVQASKGPAPLPTHAGEWVEVAHRDELPKNGMTAVEVFDQAVVIANTGRDIVAFARHCPHAEGDLARGRLRGRNILCPVHYYIWNVQTGEPVEPADEDILPIYKTQVDKAGRIWVKLR